MDATWYHAGERQMQQVAGVADQAARLARIVAPTITPAARAFLAALAAVDTVALAGADGAGRNMFNTPGNLLVNPAVGLVVPDPHGRHLQVTGTATIRVGPPGDAGQAGRSVTVEIGRTYRPAAHRASELRRTLETVGRGAVSR